MFTGIVEQVGRLVEVKPMAGGFRVRVATSLAGETQPGDSIAVNGVCLTALVAADGEVHLGCNFRRTGLYLGLELSAERRGLTRKRALTTTFTPKSRINRLRSRAALYTHI